MKNITIFNPEVKVKIQNWLWILLPMVLLPTILPRPESTSSTLQPPYSYPFASSLPGTNDRRSSLQREIAFYQTRVSQDPQSGMNPAALARVYLKMAKATGESSWYLLAEQSATRSLANLAFNNHNAILTLARIAQARHDFPEAMRLSQQVLKTQRGSEDAQAIMVTSHLAMGQLTVANQEITALASQNPNQGTLTLESLVQVAQGHDKEATDTFKLALAAEEPGETGSSAWTRTLLGQFNYRRGHLTEAGTLYREALRILPRYPQALLHLAELETRLGDYKAAESHYDQVNLSSQTATTIYDHVVLRGKARLYHLQGEETAARDLLNQAQKLLRQQTAAGQNTGAFGHRRELARLLLESDRRSDAEDALSLMRDEVKIRRDAQTLDTLAWALFRTGNVTAAQQTITAALQLGTREAPVFYRAGTIAQALGHEQQAQAYFQQVKVIDPTFDQQARQALGMGLDNFGF